MRTYLQRKDMISYHKNNYKNIVSLVKKLLNLNTNSKTQIEKFTKAVEETTPNTEKNWFLERIAKL
jgi:NAD+--asparagine ADP-ribosyltransferase